MKPLFFKIYSTNEALTPNPRSPLEDYSLHLVDLRGGKLCDTRHFKVDKIYLSHNQGMILGRIVAAYLTKLDRLADKFHVPKKSKNFSCELLLLNQGYLFDVMVS